MREKTSGVALLMVVLNIGLSSRNLGMQADIGERQQFINQTIQVSRLNGQVIQGLANLSAQTGDKEIQGLLASHGISFTLNSPVQADGDQ
jgi:hypothetical protein